MLREHSGKHYRRSFKCTSFILAEAREPPNSIAAVGRIASHPEYSPSSFVNSHPTCPSIRQLKAHAPETLIGQTIFADARGFLTLSLSFCIEIPCGKLQDSLVIDRCPLKHFQTRQVLTGSDLVWISII